MQLPILVTNADGQASSPVNFEAVEDAGTTDPHAYFSAVASRPDCFAAYSFRDKAQVGQHRSPATEVWDFDYIYPNDPYPLKQDAMKIRVRQGEVSPADGIEVSVGPSKGANLFLTADLWYGAEWDWNYARITGHKVGPVYFTPNEFGGTQILFERAKKCPENLPPGGPFIGLLYAHLNGPGFAKTPGTWRGGQTGYPRGELPYGAACRRLYTEPVQPFDTATVPGGQELGVVPSRWHRVWIFFERVPSEDWVSDHPSWLGQTMAAYKWSMWMADTIREPMRHIDERIIGRPQGSNTNHFATARSAWNVGGVNLPSKDIIRNDVVAYSRNWVVLHGISKADVLTLLQKPVE